MVFQVVFCRTHLWSWRLTRAKFYWLFHTSVTSKGEGLILLIQFILGKKFALKFVHECSTAKWKCFFAGIQKLGLKSSLLKSIALFFKEPAQQNENLQVIYIWEGHSTSWCWKGCQVNDERIFYFFIILWFLHITMVVQMT